jgi:hypothetical protein
MPQVVGAASESGGGEVRAEGQGAGGVPGAAVDRFAEQAAAGAGEQPPSGAVPWQRRWVRSMRTRTGGMGTGRTVPSGRCLRPRCSWLVPPLVQAAALRGAAAAKVSMPQPWPGR